jgi:hypothetical protein
MFTLKKLGDYEARNELLVRHVGRIDTQRALRNIVCSGGGGLHGHERMKRKLRASRAPNVAAALRMYKGGDVLAVDRRRTPHCVRWETPIGVCATWGIDAAALAHMRSLIEACLAWKEPCTRRPPYPPWSLSRNWPHITTALGAPVCVACHAVLEKPNKPITLSTIAPMISEEHGPVVLELVRQIAGEPAMIARDGGSCDYSWTNLFKK